MTSPRTITSETAHPSPRRPEWHGNRRRALGAAGWIAPVVLLAPLPGSSVALGASATANETTGPAGVYVVDVLNGGPLPCPVKIGQHNAFVPNVKDGASSFILVHNGVSTAVDWCIDGSQSPRVLTIHGPEKLERIYHWEDGKWQLHKTNPWDY